MNRATRPFDAAKVSVIGDRPLNQDRCQVMYGGETLFLCLADGLGGHPRGEVAAQLLIDVSEHLFRGASKPLQDPERFMLQCVGKAHQAILRFGQRQDPPIAPRTTAVLAIIQHGIAYWAHVGDSRLYLIREGEVASQTRDHTQVRFVRQSADEVSRPRYSLTRCLGGMLQPPTTTCGPPTLLLPDDVVLLCSDGLWSQLPQEQLVTRLAGREGPIETQLLALATDAQQLSNSDNVTAIAVRWLAEPPVQADQLDLAQPSADPQLEHAIRHLNDMLGKTSRTDN